MTTYISASFRDAFLERYSKNPRRTEPAGARPQAVPFSRRHFDIAVSYPRTAIEFVTTLVESLRRVRPDVSIFLDLEHQGQLADAQQLRNLISG